MPVIYLLLLILGGFVLGLLIGVVLGMAALKNALALEGYVVVKLKNDHYRVVDLTNELGEEHD